MKDGNLAPKCEGWWPDQGTPCKRMLIDGWRCPKGGDSKHSTEAEALYVDITTFGDAEPRYLESRCLHRHTVPVESIIDGEVLAEICLRCDGQLINGVIQKEVPNF